MVYAYVSVLSFTLCAFGRCWLYLQVFESLWTVLHAACVECFEYLQMCLNDAQCVCILVQLCVWSFATAFKMFLKMFEGFCCAEHPFASRHQTMLIFNLLAAGQEHLAMFTARIAKSRPLNLNLVQVASEVPRG